MLVIFMFYHWGALQYFSTIIARKPVEHFDRNVLVKT